jgi:hypothetical protein
MELLLLVMPLVVLVAQIPEAAAAADRGQRMLAVLEVQE